MTSWVHHPMRSRGELALELVEVTTLSALSGRKAMRSDTEPGSQGSRTLRFDSMDPVSGNRQLQYHLKVHSNEIRLNQDHKGLVLCDSTPFQYHLTVP